ncbi:MAG: hypothetical protein R3181_15070 [Rubricoccaceae bacterium]|nr:hypothetical protein [Rubricoccaceae bacterium]
MRASVLLPALLLLAALPGCASSGPPAVASGIDTTGDLVEYLNARGYVPRPAGVTVPLALDVAAQTYTLEGSDALLAVYEFDTARAAERGADAFQLDTFGGGQAVLYQRGVLVVASSGGDATLELTLTRALGPASY